MLLSGEIKRGIDVIQRHQPLPRHASLMSRVIFIGVRLIIKSWFSSAYQEFMLSQTFIRKPVLNEKKNRGNLGEWINMYMPLPWPNKVLNLGSNWKNSWSINFRIRSVPSPSSTIICCPSSFLFQITWMSFTRISWREQCSIFITTGTHLRMPVSSEIWLTREWGIG